MNKKMDKQQVLEMRTDMKLLLECLDYQRDNPAAMKQALMTLASSLQGCAESKDEFRECGGLQQVLQTVMGSKNSEVTEAGLFCLGNAVESNVYTQKLLSTANVFTYLHGVLSEHRGGSVRKKQTASFLLLCLVSNNGFGQNLMRQSTCLNDVISLIRTSLPKNTRTQSEWFEGIDGISIALWSTLVSTTCVCVNNPQNEENQRVCASLFPYLFSLLQHQTDDRIIKPILSLVGLTVSNNVQNQERVRKCGGLDILVKKLGSLQKTMEDKPEIMATVIQLLNTLDSSITENEANSQRFGALDGVTMVINLLSHFPLNEHDKTQVVLTLAHAVDICRANQSYITDSDGMTVLIHQLTVTEDPELSKTIKYLLHICVASGRPEEFEIVSNANKPVSREEKMKRHQEMEILKKINDLDSKLMSIEKDTVMKKNIGSLDTSHEQQIGSISEIMSPQSDRTSSLALARATGSFHYAEQTNNNHLATPREQSLLDQLVQEKVERQRLEQLNKMLQENMYLRNMLFAKQTEHVSVETQDQFRYTAVPYYSESNESDRNNSATTRSGKDYGQNKKSTQGSTQQSAYAERCDEPASRNSNLQGKLTKRSTREDKTDKDCQVITQNSSKACTYQADQRVASTGVRTLSNRKDIIDNTPESRHDLYGNSFSQPLDLTTKTSSGTNDNQNPPIQKRTISNNTDIPPQKRKTNRHAEIQCGTPYVTCTDAEVKTRREKTAAGMSKREAETTQNNNQANGTNYSYSNSTGPKESSSSLIMPNVSFDSSVTLKTPLVVISDINKNKDLLKVSNTPKNTKITQSQAISSNNNKIRFNDVEKNESRDAWNIDRVSRSSSEKFVKPTAIPMRSKVRVTPCLGSGMVPNQVTFVKPKLQSKRTSPSNLSVCSEFDRELVCKLQNNAPIVIRNPPQMASGSRTQRKMYVTPVIKSQNNVRKLDQHLERNAQNAAEEWNAVPSTPQQQGIMLPRPAFSDCGMRRPVLDSPYSVKSVGRLNRQGVDDSGFESPGLLRNIGSDTSSVDSNIDAFRSGSDMEEENEEPSITTSVLRNGKKKEQRLLRKRKKSSKEKCPETNPYTCRYHREVRRIERDHIQAVKKDAKGRETKRLLQDSSKKKHVTKQKKESLYDFTSDSNEDYISSPLADENEAETGICLPQRAKLRRRRIPYTDEEEFNLIEGVRRLGKCWNQILLTYKFHPSRTNIDLKDKYKRLMAVEHKDVSTQLSTLKNKPTLIPFSMCEERRLRRGVKRCGYNWKIILQSFTFAKGRTTEDLRNRWRSMHRKR